MQVEVLQAAQPLLVDEQLLEQNTLTEVLSWHRV